MAKCERRLRGDFDGLLAYLDQGILGGNVSARLEDQSDCEMAGVRCSLRVYERYSVVGGNRLSAAVTVVGCGDDLFVSAITSGGSQAVFFKINTLGEGAFLDRVVDILDGYEKQLRQGRR